jgi:hypothetical protein
MSAKPYLAVIEIPHQHRARLFWYRDRQEFIDAIAGGQAISVSTFDEAFDHTKGDLNRLIVIETEDDASWWASNAYRGHQDHYVRSLIEEVLEEWAVWFADQRRHEVERRLASM